MNKYLKKLNKDMKSNRKNKLRFPISNKEQDK